LNLALCIAALSADGQSALSPSADQAQRISSVWWLLFYVCAAVYVVVLAFTLIAAVRRKRRGTITDAPVEPREPKQERRMKIAVGSGIALTIVILGVFLISDLFAGRAMHTLDDPNPLTIEITARRWWWEVRYKDPWPSNMVITANEIHVPVGKTVKFELKSTDVIHSFWAPNFNGKKDAIPGHPSTNWFRATRAGEFRGQCAEYCGYQHAHMRFVVVAEPQEQFDKWRQQASGLGNAPSTDLQRRGQQVFKKSTCVMCHTISGTSAQASVGPNLTHVASRKLIGAASFANTPEVLRAWITDAQHLKPGVLMPQQTLRSEDVDALVAYLGSLR
jgi:cytochrome c oxidase subunit II